MIRRSTLVATIALLALGACNRQGANHQAGAGKAEGEILPGSASDAMLPVDTVKSQSPLAPSNEGGDKGKAKDATAEASDTAPDAASATPDAAKPAPAKSDDGQ